MRGLAPHKNGRVVALRFASQITSRKLIFNRRGDYRMRRHQGQLPSVGKALQVFQMHDHQSGFDKQAPVELEYWCHHRT